MTILLVWDCVCLPGREITIKVLNFRTLKMLLKLPPKFRQNDLFIEILCPKGVDGMAGSVDPDQTAHLGAV